MKVFWEEDAEDALRGLVHAGFSATEAAKEMRRRGFKTGTRNAMISKAKRLGISFHSVSARKIVTLPPLKLKGAPKRAAEAAPPAPPKPPVPKPAPPAKAVCPPDNVTPRVYADAVSFLDLPYRGRCKFPLWPNHSRPPLAQKFYCGAVIEGTGVYCTECKRGTVATRAAA